MLVISRRKGQRIAIGDDIELVVTEVHRSSVKLGIRAPRGYAVLRGEVRDSIEDANREAAATVLDGVEIDLEHTGSSAVKPPTDLLRRRQSTGDPPKESRQFEVIIRRRPQSVAPDSISSDTEVIESQ